MAFLWEINVSSFDSLEQDMMDGGRKECNKNRNTFITEVSSAATYFYIIYFFLYARRHMNVDVLIKHAILQ